MPLQSTSLPVGYMVTCTSTRWRGTCTSLWGSKQRQHIQHKGCFPPIEDYLSNIFSFLFQAVPSSSRPRPHCSIRQPWQWVHQVYIFWVYRHPPTPKVTFAKLFIWSLLKLCIFLIVTLPPAGSVLHWYKFQLQLSRLIKKRKEFFFNYTFKIFSFQPILLSYFI